MIQEQIPAFIEKFEAAEAVDPEIIEAEEDTDKKMQDTFGVAPVTEEVTTEVPLFGSKDIPEWQV